MKSNLSAPIKLKIVIYIIVVVIGVLPLAGIIIYSLCGQGRLDPGIFLRSLSEIRQWKLLGRSMMLGLCAAGMSTVIGVPMAIFIDRSSSALARFYRFTYLSPLFIPSFIHAIVWLNILSASGPINSAIKNIFHVDYPIIQASGFTAAFVILSLAYHPIIIIATLAGLKSIPSSLEEAAMLSMPICRVVGKITIPLAARYIAAGAAIVFVLSIADYAVPDLLLVKTYPVELFAQFSARYNDAAAIAGSMPLLSITVIAIYSIKYFRIGRFSIDSGPGPRSTIGIDNNLFFTIFILIMIAAVMAPLIFLFLRSGGFGNLLNTFSVSASEIKNTLFIAFSASGTAAAISLPAAYIASREKNVFIEFVVLALIAVPATVIGIIYIYVWNRPEFDFIYNSIGIVIAAHVTRFLPFAFIVCYAGIKSLDPKLEEAYSLSTANIAARFYNIIIPLLKPALITAFSICFIFSIGEVGATLLVVPPGVETLPIRIYSLLHYGADEIVASLCLGLVALSLICGLAITIYGKTAWNLK